MTHYHQTNIDLARGQFLVPGPNGYCQSLQNNDLEKLFETVRPPSAIPRSKAVFLCENPDDLDAAGGREGVVYRTEPVGRSEVSDLSWYTEAAIALDQGDQAQARICAEAYWAGTPFPVRERRTPEIRCRLARIASVYDPGDEPLVPGRDVIGRLQEATGLTESAIISLLSEDPEVLAQRGQAMDMATENPNLPDGTVLLSGFGDFDYRAIMVLETLEDRDLSEAISTEHPERIRQHPSYREYRDRLSRGERPPPIMACRPVDGRLRSRNRRRLLVAQELNAPIQAWVESLDEMTSPFTYGDFKDCLNQALAPEVVIPQRKISATADRLNVSPGRG